MSSANGPSESAGAALSVGDPGANVTSAVLGALARGAWVAMYVATAAKLLTRLIASFDSGATQGAAAGSSFGLVARALFAGLFDAAPVWLAFAFVWFFAAWFARVAAGRRVK